MRTLVLDASTLEPMLLEPAVFNELTASASGPVEGAKAGGGALGGALEGQGAVGVGVVLLFGGTGPCRQGCPWWWHSEHILIC